MWRFPSNYQRVVMSTARRLSSHTSVAPLTSCNPLSSSNIVGGNTTDVSGPCRRYVSSSVNRSNNPHAAYAPTATLKNTNRCKSTAIIPPEEEPAMGESLDESGYLGMILNAKVYDAAIETELQHAKSMSLVSFSRWIVLFCRTCDCCFIVLVWRLIKILNIYHPPTPNNTIT